MLAAVVIVAEVHHFRVAAWIVGRIVSLTCIVRSCWIESDSSLYAYILLSGLNEIMRAASSV